MTTLPDTSPAWATIDEGAEYTDAELRQLEGIEPLFAPLLDEDGRIVGVDYTPAELAAVISRAKAGTLPDAELRRALQVALAASNDVVRLYVAGCDVQRTQAATARHNAETIAANARVITQLTVVANNLAAMVLATVAPDSSLGQAARVAEQITAAGVVDRGPTELNRRQTTAALWALAEEPLLRRCGLAARERIARLARTAARLLDNHP